VTHQNAMKTVGYNCGGPMNALDTNKDHSHIIVAGRTGRVSWCCYKVVL